MSRKPSETSGRVSAGGEWDGTASIRDFGGEDCRVDFERSEVALQAGGERASVVDALDREDTVDRTTDRGNAHRYDLARGQHDRLADLHDAHDDRAHDRVHERLAQGAQRARDSVPHDGGRTGDGTGDGRDDRGEMEVVAVVAVVPMMVVRDVEMVVVVAAQAQIAASSTAEGKQEEADAKTFSRFSQR